MKKVIFLSLICCSTIFGVKAQSSNSNISLHVKIDTSKNNILRNIEFVLKNNGNETIYFINQSCDGENYFLEYDSSKIITSPLIHCNISYYYVCNLLPKQELKVNLNCQLYDTSDLKVGFRLYKVKKEFKIPKTLVLPKIKYETIWAKKVLYITTN